jgi:hypothetical protein
MDVSIPSSSHSMSIFEGLTRKYGEYITIYTHVSIRNSHIYFRKYSWLVLISRVTCIWSWINLEKGESLSLFLRKIFHLHLFVSGSLSRKRYFWLFSCSTDFRKFLFLYCLMKLRIFVRETILCIEGLYEGEDICSWSLIFTETESYIWYFS